MQISPILLIYSIIKMIETNLKKIDSKNKNKSGLQYIDFFEIIINKEQISQKIACPIFISINFQLLAANVKLIKSKGRIKNFTLIFKMFFF